MLLNVVKEVSAQPEQTKSDQPANPYFLFLNLSLYLQYNVTQKVFLKLVVFLEVNVINKFCT